MEITKLVENVFEKRRCCFAERFSTTSARRNYKPRSRRVIMHLRQSIHEWDFFARLASAPLCVSMYVCVKPSIGVFLCVTLSVGVFAGVCM